MGFGTNAQQSGERFLPVTPDLAYNALRRVVTAPANRRRHKLMSTDDFSKSITWINKASGWTWGERMSAHVRPAEGGCILNIEGVGRADTFQQAPKTFKLIESMHRAVSATLAQDAAAKGAGMKSDSNR